MSDSKVLEIANEFARRVRLISKSKNPTKWLSEVAHCSVGPSMDAVSKPGAIAFVVVDGWSDTKLAALQHEAKITLKIRAYLENSSAPHDDVHRLARDIARMMCEVESDNLNGLIIDLDGFDYTVAADFVEQAGKGEVVFTAYATYRWTHGNP